MYCSGCRCGVQGCAALKNDADWWLVATTDALALPWGPHPGPYEYERAQRPRPAKTFFTLVAEQPCRRPFCRAIDPAAAVPSPSIGCLLRSAVSC